MQYVSTNREPLVQRFRQSLNDPHLTPGSIPAKLRDTYGANSEACTDNILMFIFAGFETVASGCANLMLNLSNNPEEMMKVSRATELLSSFAGEWRWLTQMQTALMDAVNLRVGLSSPGTLCC